MSNHRALSLRMQDVLFALTSRDDYILDWYLDLRSGEVFPLYDPIAVGEDNEEREAAMDAEPDRYAKIPRYEREYRLMVAFSLTVDDDTMARMLDVALRGKGAFRRFRGVLDGHLELRDAWLAYRQAALLRWALDWLDSLGVQPRYNDVAHAPAATAEPVEEPAVAARVGLLGITLLGSAGAVASGRDAGQVLRVVPVRNEAEGLATFRRIVGELCELRGEPRLEPGRRDHSFDRPGIHVSWDERGVTIAFDVDDATWSVFGGDAG